MKNKSLLGAIVIGAVISGVKIPNKDYVLKKSYTAPFYSGIKTNRKRKLK